jgi:hypothetical protein
VAIRRAGWSATGRPSWRSMSSVSSSAPVDVLENQHGGAVAVLELDERRRQDRVAVAGEAPPRAGLNRCGRRRAAGAARGDEVVACAEQHPQPVVWRGRTPGPGWSCRSRPHPR